MDDTLRALLYVGLAVVTGASVIGLSYILGPRRVPRDPKKLAPYECGVPPLMSVRERMPIAFYLLAIFFVLFDVEVLFLVPWATAFRRLGFAGLCEMGVFVAILGIGLFYIWKRGALTLEDR